MIGSEVAIDDGHTEVTCRFVAETQINRHDFGVTRTGAKDEGSVVVGDTVHFRIDAKAVLEGD